MKILFFVLLAVFFSSASFAQDSYSELNRRISNLERELEAVRSRGRLEISGEVKTGILWERIEDWNQEANSLETEVRMGSIDDAGPADGRFRINLGYTSPQGNIGFRARLNWEDFNNPPTRGPHWTYAFGWGNFFNNQFTLSLGKLGGSPWGTGGPEMWRELEITDGGGIRVEWKPNFVPGELNVGFVLNLFDDIADAGGVADRGVTLLDLLSESVIGASYRNDWFMVRAAYRFDSELDQGGARSGIDDLVEGTKLVYRVEEYMLNRLVPGLSMWALGYFQGIGSNAPALMFETRNWLFIQYAPENFTAQVRLGLDVTGSRFVFYVKPSFSYNFLGGLLVPEIRLGYANDFGEAKVWPGSWYSYIEVEPRIRVNFAPGAYAAISYYFRQEMRFGPGFTADNRPVRPEQRTQRINLFAGITF